jgi:hypothetical protein
MKIRLNKAQKELNVGLSTIVEFLQKKGFEIKEDPNAVVPEAGYEMLVQEFSADKKARKESDDFTKERLSKEKPKAAPAVEEKPVVKEPVAPAPVVVEEKKPEPEVKEAVDNTPKVEAPIIKVTRRIDLDALNKKNAQPNSRPKRVYRAEICNFGASDWRASIWEDDDLLAKVGGSNKWNVAYAALGALRGILHKRCVAVRGNRRRRAAAAAATNH